MTAGSPSPASQSQQAAPILVLGLGNSLLGDDGVGLVLLERLRQASRLRDADLENEIEFVDGGTQGLMLLGHLEQRRAVLVLDALQMGGAPGDVRVLRTSDIESMRARRASTGHEGNALELFETARLLGIDFGELAVVGVEPEHVRTSVELSVQVEEAVASAVEAAKRVLEEMVARTGPERDLHQVSYFESPEATGSVVRAIG